MACFCPLIRQPAELLGVTDVRPQLTAPGIVEQQSWIGRLERDSTTPDSADDLPALTVAHNVKTERAAVLLLPRDDREPVRDELEAWQFSSKLISDRAATDGGSLLPSSDLALDFAVSLR